MTVTPPAEVGRPVTVYVADHGIHTSMVLPRPDGSLAQYSFSRWDWAALDQDQWYRSLPALMVPGQGTLGTRTFPGPPTRENVLHQFELAGDHPPVREIYEVPVCRCRCDHLLATLDSRWTAAEETAVFNQRRGLRFVRDQATYSLGHNCNTEVASWLRELGCRVDGPAITADVSVKGVKPTIRPTEALAATEGDAAVVH